MSANAIVGFAGVVGIDPDDLSIWSRNALSNRYFLVCGREFDKPIPIVVTDDLSTDHHPPFHKVLSRFLYESENYLVVPVSEEIFELALKRPIIKTDLIGVTIDAMLLMTVSHHVLRKLQVCLGSK